MKFGIKKLETSLCRTESHGNGKNRLNSWEWEREWEWWTGNGSEMGKVVWKKFPLVAIIIFLALYF